ncbi:mCG127499, partial [Mus musculus]
MDLNSDFVVFQKHRTRYKQPNTTSTCSNVRFRKQTLRTETPAGT